MKSKNLIGILIAMTVLITPSYAQLGSQYFDNTNFDNSTITKTELDIVQSEFSDPGILPDSPLYVFKRLGEGLKLLFTFNPESKAKLHLGYAKIRLAEAKSMANQNKTAMAQQSIDEFSKEMDKINSTSGNNSVVRERDAVLDKSSIVLGLVLDKAPDHAKPSIEAALNKSIEKSVEIRLGGKNNEGFNKTLEKEKGRNKEMRSVIRGHLREEELNDSLNRTANTTTSSSQNMTSDIGENHNETEI